MARARLARGAQQGRARRKEQQQPRRRRGSLRRAERRAARAVRHLSSLPEGRTGPRRSIDSDRRRPLRIALNAQLLSFADSYRSGGINRVIYHLLAELGRDPRGHAYRRVRPRGARTRRLGHARLSRQLANSTTSPTRRILWEQTSLPRDSCASSGLTCFTAWPTRCPSAGQVPSVVTVYDLSFLLFPKAFKPANRIYLAATTRAAARRARRILTISEHARRDIVRLLSVPEECVDVTYPAVEDRYRRPPGGRSRGVPDGPRIARGVRLYVGHPGTAQESRRASARLRATEKTQTTAVRRGRQRLARQSHLRHSPPAAARRRRAFPGLRPGR